MENIVSLELVEYMYKKNTEFLDKDSCKESEVTNTVVTLLCRTLNSVVAVFNIMKQI